MAEGGRLQALFIATVIFTLFVVGGVAMLDGFIDVSPSMSQGSDYQDFNDTFNRIDDVTGQVDTLESNVNEGSGDGGDWGTLGVLNSLIAGAWNSLTFMFTGFGFLSSIFSGVTVLFGVPSWIPTLLFTIVTIVISFAIYSAIFNRNP